MLTLPRSAAAFAACAALIAGCGESGGDPSADPASIVPGTAPLYGEVVVRPDGDQREQAEKLLEKVMRTDDVGAKLKELFDESAKEDGVQFDRDVDPWLGERAGAFLTSVGDGGKPTGAVVIAAKDTDKAVAALGKGETKRGERTYKDVQYDVFEGGDVAGAVGDFAIFGSEGAFKSVVDTSKGSGDKLTDNDDFEKAVEEAGDDALATVYVDPNALINTIASSGAIDRNAATGIRQLFAGQLGRAAAAKLRAEEAGFAVETATIGASKGAADPGEAGAAVAALPSDSWLALGVGNVGGKIDELLKQVGQLGALGGFDLEQVLDQVRQSSGIDVREDLLSWMGDAALFVRGTSIADVGGALVVSSKDPAKSRAVIAKLGRLIEQQGMQVRPLPDTPGVDTGIRLSLSGAPQIIVAAAGEKFVIAVGEAALRAALEPSQTLGDNDRFKEAADSLGDDIKPVFFFDLPSVLQLVEGFGVGDDPGYRKAQPYLRAFTTVVAGGERDGDVGRGRLVVGVR